MDIRRNLPLKDITTFRIGGNASYVAEARSREELIEALAFARKEALPFFILGGGSNVLAADEGFHGLVIRIGFSGISFEEERGFVRATAGSGVVWDHFVEECLKRDLWGVENLSGIPGMVGAVPIQNVGAYGVEVKDLIEWVEVLDANTLETKKFSSAQCRFAYRDSVFKSREGKRYIVLSVAFQLTKTPSPRLSYKDLVNYFAGAHAPPTLPNIRSAVLSIRANKFPDLTRYGTAGSFFKNPALSSVAYEKLRILFPDVPAFPGEDGAMKISLAWILEALHLKGMREGDVGTFEKQPLVIVNFGAATSNGVHAFARKIELLVKDNTGIVLEREVQSLP